MHIVIKMPIGEGFQTMLDPNPQRPVWMIKNIICDKWNLEQNQVCLVHEGRILNEYEIIGHLDLKKSNELALVPKMLRAAIDEEELIREYRYLREQFPLVRMVDLTTYEGRLRCERGKVKELADKGVWPFTEYVKWHEFKMVLSYLHPFKPPSVTWLTDINHPNIIPHKKGKVCVSLLGKKWLPNTKLAAVINSLHFLLLDPNPYSAYPNKKCKEVAKICRMFGFPLKRIAQAQVQMQ